HVRRPLLSPLFPYTTLFRSVRAQIGEGSPWRVVPGVGELLTGYYPALLWVAYLLVGLAVGRLELRSRFAPVLLMGTGTTAAVLRSEEHTSELQSRFDLVCRL